MKTKHERKNNDSSVKKEPASLKKYGKLSLRVVMLLSIIVLWFGALSTQSQEAVNKQLFIHSRLSNGIGVLFLLVSWGVWEWFIGPKSNTKLWKFLVATITMLLAVVLINGMIGLISGIIVLIMMVTIFLFDFYKLIPIGKVE